MAAERRETLLFRLAGHNAEALVEKRLSSSSPQASLMRIRWRKHFEQRLVHSACAG
jgi:hypothetical protein